MKKVLIIISILILTLLLNGCSLHCPSSCNDNNKCTKDFCSAETNFECVNEIIKPCDGDGVCDEGEFLMSNDCPTCRDSNKCTKDSYDYYSKKCVNEKIRPCCGDGICERNQMESYSSCSEDCGLTKEECLEFEKTTIGDVGYFTYKYHSSECKSEQILHCEDETVYKTSSSRWCIVFPLTCMPICLLNLAKSYDDYSICERIKYDDDMYWYCMVKLKYKDDSVCSNIGKDSEWFWKCLSEV